MSMVSRIRRTAYEVATYIKSHHFSRKIPQELRSSTQCVLIYQMGRVASQSLHDTIHACLPDVPIYHVHWLNKNNLKKAEDRVRRRYLFITKRHLLVGRKLQKFIQTEGLGGKDWLLASAVRDPIARNLSEFFLDLDKYYFPGIFSSRKKEVTVEEIAEYFCNKFDHLCRNNWFEEEIKQNFNIDITSTPFDHEKKYQLVRQGNIRLLVLRQEDLPKGLEEGVYELTGHLPKKIMRRHISGESPNSNIYSSLKKHVKLNCEILDQVYGCSWVKHLYTPEEIAAMRSKWEK